MKKRLAVIAFLVFASFGTSVIPAHAVTLPNMGSYNPDGSPQPTRRQLGQALIGFMCQCVVE